MTERAEFGSVVVEVDEGNIAAQPGFDAVVNAANAQLLPGAGVAGAIHRGAGAALAGECRPLAPIAPGTCVITRGHALPNPWVIHCLGPVYGVDQPSASLLSSCHRSAVELATGAASHRSPSPLSQQGCSATRSTKRRRSPSPRSPRSRRGFATSAASASSFSDPTPTRRSNQRSVPSSGSRDSRPPERLERCFG